MPKLVCAKCECELKCEENGVVVADMFQGNTEVYALTEADLWKCPLCEFEIVAGFAFMHFAHYFHTDFKETLDKVKATTRIIYNKEYPYAKV